ncbi:MAG: type VI secretion system baseplate subunit TssF, partial [Alphaproteobacteria bacterium]|nr:type VI secretion system baseplate subunit TssF [Alphaproteobacteria bacterium]
MSDDLLKYYNSELAFVRELAGAFAEAHPAVAGKLRLSRDAVDDPHVERLIEAFAFLTARVRRKLDDDFPELAEAVLEILYPHYQRPMPSCTILGFTSDPELTEPYRLAAGTELESEAVDGTPCRFRTVYPVTLWPVRLAEATLAERPYAAPPETGDAAAGAVLHLRLETLGDGAGFTDLALDRLRLFLRGPHHQTLPLYECLTNRCLRVAVATGVDDPEAVVLDPEAVRPVGFERDDGLVPYPPSAFSGYRLLSEYFAFAEKFLFVDLAGLEAKTLRGVGGSLHLFVFLSSAPAELARVVSAESFVLGCTPAVNLFRQRAEPIRLGGGRSRHRVEADARRPAGVEVHSVDRVTATRPDGGRVAYAPFYGVKHDARGDGAGYWLATRKSSAPGRGGSEVELALVDAQLAPAGGDDATLSVETTCLNRDVPARLPFGGGHPRFGLAGGAPAVRAVACLTPPTATLRPPLGEGLRWRLISHLALNHLSLMGEGASEALREMLRLYDVREDPDTRAAIAAVT